MKSLAAKIWMLILVFVIVTITFMYTLTDFLYERLYVNDSEVAMIEVGTKLQSQYRGGAVSDEFVELVEQYNLYSNYDVFAVRNPRELSACVPFEIDYDTLIGPQERQRLLSGESVTKIGYEPRFERDVISVVLPLVDENRLEGIIYLYYPLAKISELAKTEVGFIVVAAFVFTTVAALLGFYGLRKLLKPLRQLHTAVVDMTEGNYEARVDVTSKDEIGQLSTAFNKMANTIQQEDEAQKIFLATVSHELRTPISYVKGYSESIQQNILNEQQQREAIDVIVQEAKRMERLTNELMQLVRKEEFVHEFMPIVLAECIRDVTHLLTMQLAEKQIELQVMLDDSLIVDGDENQLKQVFINVLENAIRYSDPKSSIRIEAFEQQQQAVIRIQDTGIGIEQEHLEHITERFYRVNKARSRADGGSGLGLSIVQQITKAHNGTLLIESEINKGTTVTIQIPLIKE